MKISVKLTLISFSIAAVAMVVTGTVSFTNAKKTLKKESFNKLTAVREMKAGQITDYFEQITDQLLSMAEDPYIVEAMKGFKKGYYEVNRELNVDHLAVAEARDHMEKYVDTVFIPRLEKNGIRTAEVKSSFRFQTNALLLQNYFLSQNPYAVGEKDQLDSMPVNCRYDLVHKKYHPVIKYYLERFGYYDVFLINMNGDIVYSVSKELDFGSSLSSGPFKTSNLANCFNNASRIATHNQAHLEDFKPYLPSYNTQASFIACPIFDKNRKIGVLAFQLPIDHINQIMTNNRQWEEVGLGKTGETYIVGQDFTLRNQSRFLLEDSANYFNMLLEAGVDTLVIDQIRALNSSVGLQQVKTLGIEEALKGASSTSIFKDYRGVPVLSAFKPLDILGMNWVIMSEIDEEEAFSPIRELRDTIVQSFLGVLLVVIVVTIIFSRHITKPLKELEFDAMELAKGNLQVKIGIRQKDEIGSLANSFRKMQNSLSDLIHGLEDKVSQRTQEVVKQKDIILLKQKEIVDSLNYAKRIQQTILASEKFLNKYLPKHFLIFKPKDIVSGDFYWATKNETKFYLAVCDSTGHGVPGAFMSLLNMAFLNEAINQKHLVEPHDILNFVRERLVKNLSKDGRQDGMDGVLLVIDLKTKEVSYAAAHNAPIIIRDGEVIEFEADKMPVGLGISDQSFRTFKMATKTNDTIILSTDGYVDQFGGPKGKKLMYKKLKERLSALGQLTIAEQRANLDAFFEDWRGENEQVDDVCMVGIRI